MKIEEGHLMNFDFEFIPLNYRFMVYLKCFYTHTHLLFLFLDV